MIVKTITLQNYRGFTAPTKIVLDKHSLVIGPNGIGKTSILGALRLLLGRERMYKELDEYDWPQGSPIDDEGNEVEIRISAVITGLTQQDEDILGVAANGSAFRKFDANTNTLLDEDFGRDYKQAGIELGFAARYNEID